MSISQTGLQNLSSLLALGSASNSKPVDQTSFKVTMYDAQKPRQDGDHVRQSSKARSANCADQEQQRMAKDRIRERDHIRDQVREAEVSRSRDIEHARHAEAPSAPPDRNSPDRDAADGDPADAIPTSADAGAPSPEQSENDTSVDTSALTDELTPDLSSDSSSLTVPLGSEAAWIVPTALSGALSGALLTEGTNRADTTFFLGAMASSSTLSGSLAGLVGEAQAAMRSNQPNPAMASLFDSAGEAGSIMFPAATQSPLAEGVVGASTPHSTSPLLSSFLMPPETADAAGLELTQTATDHKLLASGLSAGDKAQGQMPQNQNTLNAALLAASQNAPLQKIALQTDLGTPSSGLAVDTPVAGVAALNQPSTPLSARPLQVMVPVNQPNWGQATGERVLWMVTQKLQSAEIQLDPPELGPLQVKITVHQDQVSITFVSQHPQVREALDLHALRLREMFEGQGLDLVNVDVSDQSFQRQADSEGEEKRQGSTAEDSAEPAPQVLSTPINQQLVDDFA